MDTAIFVENKPRYNGTALYMNHRYWTVFYFSERGSVCVIRYKDIAFCHNDNIIVK